MKKSNSAFSLFQLLLTNKSRLILYLLLAPLGCICSILFALDQATARELEKLVLSLEGVTCLMITHQPDSVLLKGCDGVWSLEAGRLVAL